MNDQHDRTARAFAAELVTWIDYHYQATPDPDTLQTLCARWVTQHYTTRHPQSMRAMIRATTNHVHAALTAAAA